MLVIGESLLQLSESQQGAAAHEGRVAVVGTDRQGAIEDVDSFAIFAAVFDQAPREVQQRIVIIRLQLDRLAEVEYSFVIAPELRQHPAEVVVRGWQIRTQRDSATEKLDGFGGFFLLHIERAEV